MSECSSTADEQTWVISDGKVAPKGAVPIVKQKHSKHPYKTTQHHE